MLSSSSFHASVALPSPPPSIAVVVARIKKSSASVGERGRGNGVRNSETIVSDFGRSAAAAADDDDDDDDAVRLSDCYTFRETAQRKRRLVRAAFRMRVTLLMRAFSCY